MSAVLVPRVIMAEPVLIHLLEVSPVIALERDMKETRAKLVNTINNNLTLETVSNATVFKFQYFSSDIMILVYFCMIQRNKSLYFCDFKCFLLT